MGATVACLKFRMQTSCNWEKIRGSTSFRWWLCQIGSYLQLLAARKYTFSMDFRNYGTSMYSGDQFELHRPGGVSHGNPVIVDIGNNWKPLTRTVSPSSDIQYKIHFAKFKSSHQYIDNGVVLDVTDIDGNGIPHYRENISLAGYGSDPFFFIRVQAKDEHNATVEGNFTVTLTDLNESPSISSNQAGSAASIEIAENQTIVTTVTASDPDFNSSLLYSISGGVDQAKFQINTATGELTFQNAPDFENPTDQDANNVYEVTVRASDGLLDDEQVITITTKDIYESSQSNHLVDLNSTVNLEMIWVEPQSSPWDKVIYPVHPPLIKSHSLEVFT